MTWWAVIKAFGQDPEMTEFCPSSTSLEELPTEDRGREDGQMWGPGLSMGG